MIYFRKDKAITFYFICLFIFISFLFVSGCNTKASVIPDEPPEIKITTSDGTLITWNMGINMWNGCAYDRADTIGTLMTEIPPEDIPYIELGTQITIEFKGYSPSEYFLKDEIVNQDGEPRYNSKVITYPGISFIDNATTIVLTSHPDVFLSSDSKDYEPGAVLRGFKLTCSWEHRECEYGFVIRTDAGGFNEEGYE